MGLNASASKVILRHILWDVERQLHEEQQRLHQQGATEAQLHVSQAMVESLAGNAFYSATTSRYAQAVPGSRLAK
ncbi:terpenoid synthase [Penicillium verrucosum]|uniref:terpenoid synthase n=1 Tax=Penicillium verrucosum TaxID=60171 RepID=UPI002545A268|nr:terpenoid synthase [Penicillium verrucosum]KAJ5945232.1 terpenoid synthase [Penicillium verrucosum]